MLTYAIEEQMKVQPDLKQFFERNEKGDAELLVQILQGRVVYDHSSKDWYLWRGQYWELDRKREVFEQVMNRVAAEYLQAAGSLRAQGGQEAVSLSEKYIKRAGALLARKRVENVLYIAQSDPAVALSGEEWDRSPDLLPVNNGVIDLQTGERRDCRPDEHIRAHAPVDWMGPDYGCPVWEKILREIFDGDDELVAFIQRLFGYAISGHVTEHKLPIFLGEEGRNGKTTLFETLREVLGIELCASIPTDVLMDTRRSGEGPQPFLYGLRGKRLAYASESREGQRINSSLIKQLTGGDTLNVRTLHSKPVTFQPTHKIMLSTNRKPAVPADDQATWERILLIPLEIRFVDRPQKPNERQKKDLRSSLRVEYPGILAWLVRGCLDWRQHGLAAPDRVQTATRQYREEEDTIALFLVETYDRSPEKERQSKLVYQDYLVWASACGMNPVNRTVFGKRLKLKLKSEERRGVIYYIGIAPKV